MEYDYRYVWPTHNPDIYKKVSAMRFYRAYGMEPLKSIYPAQVEFVEANKDVPADQLESQLLAQLKPATV